MTFELGRTADGKIILRFPEPVAWIGLTAVEAEVLAEGLRAQAEAVRALAQAATN